MERSSINGFEGSKVVGDQFLVLSSLMFPSLAHGHPPFWHGWGRHTPLPCWAQLWGAA